MESNEPKIIMAPNKTLAAQLYAEMSQFIVKTTLILITNRKADIVLFTTFYIDKECIANHEC